MTKYICSKCHVESTQEPLKHQLERISSQSLSKPISERWQGRSIMLKDDDGFIYEVTGDVYNIYRIEKHNQEVLQKNIQECS